MSEVRVNKLSPRSGTTVTLGDSGDTITIPSGVTFDASSGGLAGTLTTAAQPNITSVGTLTSFTSTGIDDNATSTAITISSSENVGIGTTSPTDTNGFGKALDIQGSTGGAIYVGSSGDRGIFAYASGEQHIINPSASGTTRFTVNGSERMRINSSGNVLIGTTDAGYPVFGDNLTLEGSTHSGITIRSGTSSQGNLYFSDATGTGTGTYAGAINYLHSVDAMVFRSDSTERMRIDSSGRVGIGETSMDALLVVRGNSDSSTTPSIRLKDGTDAREAFVTNQSGDLIMATTNSSDDAIDSAIKIYTSQMIFSVDNNTERMRIDSSGNVGIGETSPVGKLHIKSADSGTTLNTAAGQLFLENSGNAGMTIGSGTSSLGLIYFADSDDGNVGRLEYSHSENSMRFWTNDSERMRIDSSGRLVINATNPDTGAIQTISHDGNSTYGLSLATVNTSGTQYHQRFLRGGTGGTMAGYITSNSATTIAFNNASDERLKENIQNSNSAIQDLKDIQVRQFDWKDNIDTHRDFGFVAQELVNVVPEAVTQGTDELDDNGKPVRSWGVDYSHIVPRLVKVCQEQQTKIEELEARITALETNQP
jgi:hypothetical protein